jgi:hypothetical protein
MKTPAFEANKLRRLIRVQGVSYTFFHPKENEFGEALEKAVETQVHGVLHSTSQYISVTHAESASVQEKNSPMILALFEEAKNIQQGDYTVINDTRYNVTAVSNVAEWNVIADISLEAVM